MLCKVIFEVGNASCWNIVMNYQEEKGKIHYDLFINQSNRAGETLLNYASHAKPSTATSWRHFGSLRSALPFLQINRYKTFILRIECWYHMDQELLFWASKGNQKGFSIQEEVGVHAWISTVLICAYNGFISGEEDWPHMKKFDILDKIKCYERMTFTAVLG